MQEGAKPGPIQGADWCCSTARPGKLYLHLFAWPEGGGFGFPPLARLSAKHTCLAIHRRRHLPLAARVRT